MCAGVPPPRKEQSPPAQGPVHSGCLVVTQDEREGVASRGDPRAPQPEMRAAPCWSAPPPRAMATAPAPCDVLPKSVQRQPDPETGRGSPTGKASVRHLSQQHCASQGAQRQTGTSSPRGPAADGSTIGEMPGLACEGASTWDPDSDK